MSNYSQNIGLELPTEPEHYNVGVFNKNAMVIDSEIHKLILKNQSQDELLATKEALNSEATRAKSSENKLFDDITNETNRASIAEETINNNLSALISELTTRFNALADSDDTTLDQLSEIVSYIKNNKDLIDGITTSKINVSDIVDDLLSGEANKPLSANQGKVLKELITNLIDIVNNKVDMTSGKGLSTNDYTTADKNKLDGIASGAEVNVQSDWSITDTANDAYIKNKPTIPTKTSQIANDSNYVGINDNIFVGNRGEIRIFNTLKKEKSLQAS